MEPPWADLCLCQDLTLCLGQLLLVQRDRRFWIKKSPPSKGNRERDSAKVEGESTSYIHQCWSVRLL